MLVKKEMSMRIDVSFFIIVVLKPFKINFCVFATIYRFFYDKNNKSKGGDNMNHVGLVGRITKDPIIKRLPENRVQTKFVLAINRNFRNDQGTVEADFVLCVAWGKLAEHIERYCGKGSLIGVNGRIHTYSFMNQENKRIYLTEVVVEDVRFYALKTREDQFAHAMLEESFPTGQGELPADLAEHFELPDELKEEKSVSN